MMLLIGLVMLYFLPWIVAVFRSHNDTLSIGIVNLFFGWTFIGWVLALVWAVSGRRS